MTRVVRSGESLELSRMLAEQRVAQLHEIWKINLEQHFHSFRWLVATMLLINSGAAISLLNVDTIAVWVRMTAGGAFAAGVLASLVHALRAQGANVEKMKELQRRIAFWLAVEQTGSAQVDLEAQMQGEMDRLFEWPLSHHFVGWLPGILFGTGLAVLGYGALLGAVR